jgi:flagellar protein FlgJ
MGIGRTAADAAQSFALDANALAGLRRQAREAPDQALSKAAGQFEALFLNMVLKQMRETLPKDGPLDSDTMRTYTSMFDQQVAQHLSSRGIGLREAIERQLAKRIEGTKPTPGAETPSPQTRASVPISQQKLERTSTPLPAHPPSAPTSSASSNVASTVQAFVEKLRPHAEKAAVALGVPAHLLIAQAGLETGWGRSQPRNADGSPSHNLFGVKAGQRWTGATIAAATTEFVQGAAVRTVEKFRAYGSYTDAFRDLTRVLSNRRYADAVANAGDPAAYAKSLQRAGYATDPAYADKLTRAIRMVSQQFAADVPTDGARLARADAIQDSVRPSDIPFDAPA